jgi:hypothetical protein
METDIDWGQRFSAVMNAESFCAYFAFAGQRNCMDCQSMVAARNEAAPWAVFGHIDGHGRRSFRARI